jgi:hypothetical protein
MAKMYQRRFADHVETFALRRSELQTLIGAYTASGIDAANIALVEVKKTTNATDSKVDSILAILQRLESPHDRDVLKFIDENGGPQNCVYKDDLLLTLLNKTRQSSEIDTLRTSLRQEVHEDLDAVLNNNLQRFEKLLKVQNHNLERISDQIVQVGKSMNDHDMKLDTIMRTSILIYEEGKTIKKAVAPTAPIKLKDPVGTIIFVMFWPCRLLPYTGTATHMGSDGSFPLYPRLTKPTYSLFILFYS